MTLRIRSVDRVGGEYLLLSSLQTAMTNSAPYVPKTNGHRIGARDGERGGNTQSRKDNNTNERKERPVKKQPKTAEDLDKELEGYHGVSILMQ